MGVTFEGQRTTSSDKQSYCQENHIRQSNSLFLHELQTSWRGRWCSLDLVTQSAPFNGYKDMDPSEIPQFEAGKKEAIAQKLLEEAGTSNRYQ